MSLFLFIVILLFVLAAFDLIVGVSNDAVNFLNSALGSKVASVRTILIIATLGILAGSFFSSGIMEVARKGIFNPQYFTFDKIMILFLAVMLTDIILLDLFNTFSLPTSTTVSIVFELLGAAFMVGLLMSIDEGQSLNEVGMYINGSNAMKIIAGIFLSVLIAFNLGAIVQYLSRLIFTFNYEKNLQRFGAPFAGAAITAITYFLLIKGLKGTSLSNSDIYTWILERTWTIIGMMIVFWILVCWLLMKLAKINPLKMVVLAGTFALAMAFAGNDLVNFIGVPVAGFLSYKHWLTSGVDPSELYMSYLNTKVQVPDIMLVAAGVIMSVTLWLSAKARKVTETEVNLGRQDEGDERFEPNQLARFLVRMSIKTSAGIRSLMPDSVVFKLEKSFDKNEDTSIKIAKDKSAFDLVRASINLVVASIIIAYATSQKMPLSTTYVSFMVAMGTSLADKAWGRESAVYRVAGVLNVIGGWFLTAILAFFSSAFIALIMFYWGLPAIIFIILLVAIILITSQRRFKQRDKEAHADEASILSIRTLDKPEEELRNLVAETLDTIKDIYSNSLSGLQEGKVDLLDANNQEMKSLLRHIMVMRKNEMKEFKYFKAHHMEVGGFFLQVSDLLHDISQANKFLTRDCLQHVRNLHSTPHNKSIKVLNRIGNEIPEFIGMITSALKNNEFDKLKNVIAHRDKIRAYVNKQIDKQVDRAQDEKISIKEGLLLTEILYQSRDVLAISLRIYKLFWKEHKKNNKAITPVLV